MWKRERVSLCFPFSSWPSSILYRYKCVKGKQPQISIFQGMFLKPENPQNLFRSIFSLINRKSDHPVKSDIFLDGNLFLYLFRSSIFSWGCFVELEHFYQLLWRLGHEETIKMYGGGRGNFINNKKWSNSSAMKQEMSAGIWSFCCALDILGGLLMCFIPVSWKATQTSHKRWSSKH